LFHNLRGWPFEYGGSREVLGEAVCYRISFYHICLYLSVVLCSVEALPLETRQMVQQRVLFKDVYEVCSGSIYLMKLFLHEYLVDPGENLSNFSQVCFSFPVGMFFTHFILQQQTV